MKIDLTNASFLTIAQLGNLTSSLDALHQRVIKAIDRLQHDVGARKAEIANRWKRLDGISAADRQRLAEQETSKAVLEIKANSQKEVDGLMREAGRLHTQIMDQKSFYASKAMVLNRAGLGTDRRANIEQTTARARPATLAGMMQFAIGTNDLVMAAAVVLENDTRRESDRGFSSQDALALITVEEFDKAHEYLKIADVRLQGIVLAVRAWTMGRANPIDTVSLAMRNRELNLSVLGHGGDDGDDV